jgi:hypothetical protein
MLNMSSCLSMGSRVRGNDGAAANTQGDVASANGCGGRNHNLFA